MENVKTGQLIDARHADNPLLIYTYLAFIFSPPQFHFRMCMVNYSRRRSKFGVFNSYVVKQLSVFIVRFYSSIFSIHGVHGTSRRNRKIDFQLFLNTGHDTYYLVPKILCILKSINWWLHLTNRHANFHTDDEPVVQCINAHKHHKRRIRSSV